MSQLLTVREVAEYLRVNPETVYRMVPRKELKALKINGRSKQPTLRFDRDALSKWIDRNST